MTDHIIDADTHVLSNEGVVTPIPAFATHRYFESPLCSIIVTCYNYGAFLQEAIDSVLTQTFPSLEIIIVDDGSTDSATLEIVKSFVGKPNIQVIFKHNQGLPAARNTGIGAAQGKYICCLDADDIFHPSYIEHCIFELEAHRNLGFVYSWVQFFGDEVFCWKTSNFNVEISMQHNITCGAAVFRRADWLMANQYNATMTDGFEDWHFWLQLAQLGRCGKMIPLPIFFYRRHGITMSRQSEEKREKLVKRIQYNHAVLFEKTAWFETVKKYTTDISASHFPAALAQTIKKSSPLLCVIDGENTTQFETKIFPLLAQFSQQAPLVVVALSNNIHGVTEKLLTVTQDFFYYANSTRADTAHFTHFLGYLLETRSVQKLMNINVALTYPSLADIKKRLPKLVIQDYVLEENAVCFHQAVMQAEHIDQYDCLSKNIQNALLDYGIAPEKIIYAERESVTC